MGPPSAMSEVASTVGSCSSWDKEYEDEDTWYEWSSAYQSGQDTQLLPSQDTAMSVRMAKYRRTSGSKGPNLRSGMRQRRDLRDIEKEREEEMAAAGMS